MLDEGQLPRKSGGPGPVSAAMGVFIVYDHCCPGVIPHMAIGTIRCVHLFACEK